ncbi:unnamed protein product [Rotaria sp. Silwood2]|nr:unnamed protein product [Rotaria sp. Silwood2]CAF3398326.1 unnamed protein product [Rotaria sp. Silwood2]CAF4208886.1 unnamed protein product [Rotaria sp. Silwood2]CAF4306505.1 unnamed protein product [Rotaria sp. Silwood2]
MQLQVSEMEDVYWEIVLEEVNNKEYPLRKLTLDWEGFTSCGIPIQPGFIKLMEALRSHKTLVEFQYHGDNYSRDEILIALLKSLKNNDCIKYLSISSLNFDLEAARVLSQMLTNNQTLISLSIKAYSDYLFERGETWSDPINSESVVELARSLQTTALKWLKINQIDDKSFEILARSLPQTLIHLNLAQNNINEEKISTIISCLQSNAENLKELILDDDLATQYFQNQASSSLSTVKIASNKSLSGKLLRKEDHLQLSPHELDDSDWSLMATALTKDDTTYRKLELFFSEKFNPNYLNYLETLFGKQCRLTSLIIRNYFLDKPIQIEILRMLKENNSINELEVSETNFAAFNELGKLLENNNKIKHVNLVYISLNDENCITLANYLKNNHVLQSLKVYTCETDDIGFQAILSSLPNSLSKLEFTSNRISDKILPALLTFVETHPLLKQISLQQYSGNKIYSTLVNGSDLMAKIHEVTNKNHCICQIKFN